MRTVSSGRPAWLQVLVLAVFWSAMVWTPALASEGDGERIAAGERLIELLDCNVCHTPKTFTARGPQPDRTRLLSGHPEGEAVPAVPDGLMGPTGWGGLFSNGMTAWVGPWGVSFGSNLTPDAETGIGAWSEEDFIEAMHTGTHMEETRPFLPPMPTYVKLTEDELRAMFAYLRSIEPVRNAVPQARPAPPPPGQEKK